MLSSRPVHGLVEVVRRRLILGYHFVPLLQFGE